MASTTPDGATDEAEILGWVVYNELADEVYGGHSPIGETLFEKPDAEARRRELVRDPNVDETDADLSLAAVTHPSSVDAR